MERSKLELAIEALGTYAAVGAVIPLKPGRKEAISFPETLKVCTATGGEHWVYKARPNPQRKNAVAFLPGLDLKTQGGYLVAAGSVIGPGEYPDNPDGGRYEVIDD